MAASSFPNASPTAASDAYAGRLFWSALAAFIAVTSFLRFVYFYLDDVTRGHAGTLARRSLEEGSGMIASLVVFLPVILLVRRFPLDRGRLARSLPVHALAALVVSVVHTSLMAGMRFAASPLLGMGPYDYGRMSVRFWMELPQDLIGYGVVLGFAALFHAQHSLRRREVQAQALERSLAEARLQALRLQLQPHFLFNTLNTISSTLYDDPAAADEMIGRLGELLRRSLGTAAPQEVPLREELEMLEHYVALLRARFGTAVDVTVDVAPGTEDAALPSLLLQPLVENAVRHGNAARIGRGRIEVRARRGGDELVLEVEDDGPGIVPGSDPVGSGLGLGATARRLQLLYGDAHRFDAANVDGGGFRVALRIPFRVAAPSLVSASTVDEHAPAAG